MAVPVTIQFDDKDNLSSISSFVLRDDKIYTLSDGSYVPNDGDYVIIDSFKSNQDNDFYYTAHTVMHIDQSDSISDKYRLFVWNKSPLESEQVQPS